MQTPNPRLYPHQLYSTNAIDLPPSESSELPSIAAPFPDNGPAAHKKRKVDRACDACRRRKTKCDGPKMPDHVCTNCLQTRKSCTYLEASKPRGPPKAYVTGLEDRVEQLEAILKQLQPGVDFSEELGPPILRGSWKADDYSSKSHASSSTTSLQMNPSLPSISLHPPKTSTSEFRLSNTRGRSSPPPLVDPRFVCLSSHLPFSSSTSQSPALTKRTLKFYTISSADSDQDSFGSDDASSDTDALVESYGGEPQRLTLRGAAVSVVDGEDNHRRFHGKSSAASLVDATRKFKQMHLLSMEGEGESTSITPPPATSLRRAEFWCSPKWELVWEGLHVDSPELIPQVLSNFPPEDLALSLIDLYFLHTNTQFPLLHRPTFERQWKQKLHHRDIWFACLCLCVFAVASRWSDDPRVLTPPIVKSESGGIDWSSAGWKYFTAGVDIHRYRRSLLYPATLFEVQTFTLLSMFLRGSTSPAAAWVFVSIGLRKAQDAGAHRKNVYRERPTIDEELWKRAFWCLIMADRIGGVSLGRGCSLNEEDFDLDLPLDVDDEYMETGDPGLAFKQPPGVPSKITAFVLLLKLMQILSFAMKTIYVVNKARVFSGVFALDWRDEIVSQLNKAMNDWAESIPEHLRWSEDMPDLLFSNQAATLYITYYLTQMVIFRPFVPSPTRSSNPTQAPTIPPFPFPAMTICISAAQSSARIIDHQLKRGFSNIPAMCMVSHTGGGMLSWAIWDLKVQERLSRLRGSSIAEDVKPPITHKVQEYIGNISVFIKAMEWSQPRWHMVTPLLANLRESLPTVDDQFFGDDRNTLRLFSRPIPLSKANSSMHIDTGVDPSWGQDDAQSWPWSQPARVESGKLDCDGTLPCGSIISEHTTALGGSVVVNPTPFTEKALDNPYNHPGKLNSVRSDSNLHSSFSLLDAPPPWSSPSEAPQPPPGRTRTSLPRAPTTSSSDSEPSYVGTEMQSAGSSLRRTSYPSLGTRYQQNQNGQCGRCHGIRSGSLSRGMLKYDDINIQYPAICECSPLYPPPLVPVQRAVGSVQALLASDKRVIREPEWDLRGPNPHYLRPNGHVSSPWSPVYGAISGHQPVYGEQRPATYNTAASFHSPTKSYLP